MRRATEQNGLLLQGGLKLTSYSLLGQTGVTLVLQQHGPQLSATLVGIEGAAPQQPQIRAFAPSSPQRPSTASIYLPESGRTLELVAPCGRYPDDLVRFEVTSKDPKGDGISARFLGNGHRAELTDVSAVSNKGSYPRRQIS